MNHPISFHINRQKPHFGWSFTDIFILLSRRIFGYLLFVIAVISVFNICTHPGWR